MRALCPGCRQCPQSLGRLEAGGSSLSAVVVKVVVVVVVVVIQVGGGVGGVGEREGEGSTDGPPGRGHVVSFK